MNCIPYRHSSTYGRQPSDLNFTSIKENYGYKATWYKNDRLSYSVPSFKEFVSQFGQSAQIKKIVLDVKPKDRNNVRWLMEQVMTIARNYNIENKVIFTFAEKDLLGFAQSLDIYRTSRSHLVYSPQLTLDSIGGEGVHASLTSASEAVDSALRDSDEVDFFERGQIGFHMYSALARMLGNAVLNSVTIYRQVVDSGLAVKTARSFCASYASLSHFPLPGYISDALFKNTFTVVEKEREMSGYEMRLVARTINSETLLRWLIENNADGVVTDKPAKVKRLLDKH